MIFLRYYKLFMGILLVFTNQIGAMDRQLFAGTDKNGSISVFNISIDSSKEAKKEKVVVSKSFWHKLISNFGFFGFNFGYKNDTDIKIKTLFKEKIAGFIGSKDSKLVFSPINNNIVAYNCENGDIKVNDLSKLSEKEYILHGHTGRVNSIEFSFFDKNMLISGSDDKTVRIWDLSAPENFRCICILKAHSNPVSKVIFSPVSPYFCISISVNGEVIVWDLDKNNQNNVIKNFVIASNSDQNLSHSIYSLKFSKFDTHIIAYFERATNESVIKILDFSKDNKNMCVKKLDLCKLLPSHGGLESIELKKIDSIKFLDCSKFSNNKIAIYGFENNIFGGNLTENILVYNNFEAKNDKIIQTYVKNNNSGLVGDIKFDDNKDRVFSFYLDGSKIKVYDIEQQKHIETIKTNEVFVNGSFSFSQGISDRENEFKKLLFEAGKKRLYDLFVKFNNSK